MAFVNGRSTITAHCGLRGRRQRDGAHHQPRFEAGGTRALVGEQAGEPVATNPRRQPLGRVRCCHGPIRIARGTAPSGAEAVAAQSRPCTGTMAIDVNGKRSAAIRCRVSRRRRRTSGGVAVLGLEHDRLGHVVGLVDQRAHARLQQIRADVEEQQQAGEQEEADDQQAGDEPDKEIREDQLAAHAPQQPPLGPDDAARDAVTGDERSG